MTRHRSIALVGANGMLAHMVRRKAPEDVDFSLLDLPDFDLTDRDLVLRTLEGLRPDIIVNCAAYTDVDGCESNEEAATRVNGQGPGFLAEAALRTGASLVHISTDYVFDGTSRTPYTEEDPPAPRSAYGRSKLLGERTLLESGLQSFYIIRTSWLYGPGGKNFVKAIIRLAGDREELTIVDDQVGSPTFTGDLAEAIFHLIDSGKYGLYHFSNAGQCSWYEFARQIVGHLEESGEALAVKQITPIPTEDFPLPAPRPAYSVLSTEKYRSVSGESPPRWQVGLQSYFKSTDD